MAGARYSTSSPGFTPIAHANGASALANSSYHGIRNAAITDVMVMKALTITGEGIATAVNRMAVRRTSTLVSTPTNVAPGPKASGAGNASQQQFVLASTGPTLASTTPLLTAALNVFGGIIGIQFTPDDEASAVGTTQPNGEMITDSISGTGVVSVDVTIEAF